MLKSWLVVLAILILPSFHTSTCSKIHNKVTKQFTKSKTINVLVHCEDVNNTRQETAQIQEILEHLKSTTNTRSDLGCTVLNRLIKRHQALVLSLLESIIELLDRLKLPYKIFWVPGIIHIREATAELLQNLTKFDIVTEIRLERKFRIILPKPPKPAPYKPRPPPSGNTSWNLGLIDARCSKIKRFGEGVRVGSIDTGVLWKHVELKDNFQHDDYSWWDPYDDEYRRVPREHDPDASHGTHTTGIAVGKTVGVAPHAVWMACKGCTSEDCVESALLECMHYMASPWRWDDDTQDYATKDACRRPHVINCSWGGSGGGQTMYPSKDPLYKMVDYWNRLDIVSVFSAGNAGPGCSALDLPGSFPISLSVGAIDKNVTIGYFSGRGPAILAQHFTPNSYLSVEGYNCFKPPALEECTNKTLARQQICQYIKPDIVAPGVNINSSWNTGVTDYYTASGTSMSAPHVTGIIALMISVDLDFNWNYKNVYQILRETADTTWIDLLANGEQITMGSFAKASNILCNYLSSDICDKYPNNLYGKGLAYACKAVERVQELLEENGKPWKMEAEKTN